MKTFFKPLAVLAIAGLATGCMHKAEAPALSGPSTNALAVNLSATPDRITQDGASQSSVIAEVLGPDGRPLAGVSLRVDMKVPCLAAQNGCVNGFLLMD